MCVLRNDIYGSCHCKTQALEAFAMLRAAGGGGGGRKMFPPSTLGDAKSEPCLWVGGHKRFGTHRFGSRT